MELGTIDPAKAPMLAHQGYNNSGPPPPPAGYAEMDSSPTGLPYRQQGAIHTGSDLGNPYGQGSYAPYSNQSSSPNPFANTQAALPYTDHSQLQQQSQGPTLNQQPSYSAYTPSNTAYTPSNTTQYEPSSASGYGNAASTNPFAPAAVAAPNQAQQYPAHAPGVLQAGRQPMNNSWRDV